jgi:hypothetical protein
LGLEDANLNRSRVEKYCKKKKGQSGGKQKPKGEELEENRR